MKLYSYTMTVDDGFAPNPTGGICTLAYCMVTMRRTVQAGDYVVGLAGAEYRKRRGAEWPAYPVIYAMRVTDVIGFEEFRRDERYRRHFSPHLNTDKQVDTDRVLVSDDFIYWGGDGPPLPRKLSTLIKQKGPGHLCNFPPGVVREFVQWFESQPDRGLVGRPFADWYTWHH
jgi:hypothetical protein